MSSIFESFSAQQIGAYSGRKRPPIPDEAGHPDDKDAIKAQVDEIVAAMEGGKMATDFADAAKREPCYVYIMEENGTLLVHPSLTGENLMEKAKPSCDAVVQATPESTWVKYMWKEKEKNAYVRKTSGGLIVGSGYQFRHRA